MQLPHIPVTTFSQTDLFLFKFISNSDPHRNLSDKLQSQARTIVDMSTCSRETAFFCPYRSVLMKTGTAYFTGKISKHRLVYINAVALPYYVSCRLAVMGSWPL